MANALPYYNVARFMAVKFYSIALVAKIVISLSMLLVVSMLLKVDIYGNLRQLFSSIGVLVLHTQL